MKIYCVIDVQNDFINGVLGSHEAQLAVDRIWQELKLANPKEDLVITTQDTHYDNYLDTQEGKYLPIKHCIYYSKGWDIDYLIKNVVGSFNQSKSFTKKTFGSKVLEHQLELIDKDDVEEIIFMGFCTDICVVTNALIAKMVCPEIPIKVIADCCAGTTPEKHKAALEVMRSCQIEVV